MVAARHQMNGVNGHLDRLLDLCHARHLPLLTAFCVNQAGVSTGELGEDPLAGFVTGARRLGLLVTNARAFHHKHRDDCWAWARRRRLKRSEMTGQIVTVFNAEALQTPLAGHLGPELTSDAGEAAGWRYIDFLTSYIRNLNTQCVYTRACGKFLA